VRGEIGCLPRVWMWARRCASAEVGAGQQPGQRGQDRAVGPERLRRPGLAMEHGDLVAQEEDLGVLGAGEQGESAEDAEYRQISES